MISTPLMYIVCKQITRKQYNEPLGTKATQKNINYFRV